MIVLCTEAPSEANILDCFMRWTGFVNQSFRLSWQATCSLHVFHVCRPLTRIAQCTNTVYFVLFQVPTLLGMVANPGYYSHNYLAGGGNTNSSPSSFARGLQTADWASWKTAVPALRLDIWDEVDGVDAWRSFIQFEDVCSNQIEWGIDSEHNAQQDDNLKQRELSTAANAKTYTRNEILFEAHPFDENETEGQCRGSETCASRNTVLLEIELCWMAVFPSSQVMAKLSLSGT